MSDTPQFEADTDYYETKKFDQSSGLTPEQESELAERLVELALSHQPIEEGVTGLDPDGHYTFLVAAFSRPSKEGMTTYAGEGLSRLEQRAAIGCFVSALGLPDNDDAVGIPEVEVVVTKCVMKMLADALPTIMAEAQKFVVGRAELLND